jgi:hypothetical protein
VAKSDLLFMPGTTAKYLVVARRGKIALGIRPYPILPGEKLGCPGKAYLPVRLHSRVFTDGLPQYGLDDEDNVVQLEEAALGLDDAWPDVQFESVTESRAATMLGVFIRGSFGDPEAMLAGLKKYDLYHGLATCIAESAGYTHLVIRVGELTDWLQEQYKEAIAKFEASLNANKEFAEYAEAHVEKAGFHTLQIHKLFEKHQQLQLDQLNPGQQDADGDDDGDEDDDDED